MQHRKRMLLAALVLGAAACSRGGDGATGEGPRTPRPRHVFLVTVDTLRADHLTAWGYPRPTSDAAGSALRGSAAGTTIDELAAGGVRFARAFAPVGMTFPSISTLMTGRTPLENCTLGNASLLPEDAPTLALALSDAGFETAAFTTNRLLVEGSGIERGFEHFASAFGDGQDAAMSEAAAAWIEATAAERGDARLFVWLHLMAPHQPYQPPATDDVDFARLFTDPNYTGPVDGSREVFDAAHAARVADGGDGALDARDAAQGVALYDGEVAYVDRLVSRFAARLAALGLLDDGLFVLAADHGEELGQRHAYWAHSKSVYGSVLHVPLLMRHPPTFAAGTVVNELVALEDVAPTVLELAGVPSRVLRQGRSLVPLFTDRRAFDERFVMGQWRDRIYTLRNRRWRLVWNPDEIEPVDPPAGSYPISELALYETASDPAELVDVAAEHPVLVRRLKEALNAWRIGLPPCREPRSALDPARRTALSELGYAGEDDPLDAARENVDQLDGDQDEDD